MMFILRKKSYWKPKILLCPFRFLVQFIMRFWGIFTKYYSILLNQSTHTHTGDSSQGKTESNGCKNKKEMVSRKGLFSRPLSLLYSRLFLGPPSEWSAPNPVGGVVCVGGPFWGYRNRNCLKKGQLVNWLVDCISAPKIPNPWFRESFRNIFFPGLLCCFADLLLSKESSPTSLGFNEGELFHFKNYQLNIYHRELPQNFRFGENFISLVSPFCDICIFKTLSKPYLWTLDS